MDKNNFLVLDTPFLAWPEVEIPAKRFRLLLAADARQVTNESIAHFAFEALKRGMVYLCAWGPDCERVHDTFDGVSLEDYLGERRFSLPGEEDTIMTTWHAEESLEDAVDFFVNCSQPTNGYVAESEFWVAISVDNACWAETIREQLR